MEALWNWGWALLDFAYPPHCAVCEAEIGTGGRFVCGRDTALEQIAVLGDFTGALQQAVYAVKFHNQPHSGRVLGGGWGAAWRGN